jgi:ParB-like chromosome segregation protein Spo0J
LTRKIIEIEVEKIRPNLRLIYHYEAIEEFCYFVQSGGEIEPLQIWFDGECFQIWDGEKRWRVCKRLGITRVKAFLIEFS